MREEIKEKSRGERPGTQRLKNDTKQKKRTGIEQDHTSKLNEFLFIFLFDLR